MGRQTSSLRAFPQHTCLTDCWAESYSLQLTLCWLRRMTAVLSNHHHVSNARRRSA